MEWISTKKEIPPESCNEVLIYTKGRTLDLAIFIDGDAERPRWGGRLGRWEVDEVLYWMPMPDSPET